MKNPRISIVAAIGNGRLHNRVLGKDNQLIWHIPDDLKRFRSLTRGHPVIMGRKTFESIIASRGSPLPERPNIVVTRDPSYTYQGRSLVIDVDNPSKVAQKMIHQGPTLGDNVIVVSSIEEGIARAKELDSEEIHIGGGAEIYKQALPLVDKLYLTLIDDDKEGDTYFPEYADQFTKKTLEESHEWNGIHYTWVDLER